MCGCGILIDVGNDRISAALNALKGEREVVGRRLSGLQRELQESAALLQRLDNAIASLEADAGLMAQYGMGQPPAVPGDLDIPRLQPNLSPAQRLTPFLTRGVGKERDALQSAKMVAAVVDYVGTPSSREQVRVAFFEYFGREYLMSSYWNDPDKAFRSAFRRAVEREMVVPIVYPDGQTVYMGGFREIGADRPMRVEPIGDV